MAGPDLDALMSWTRSGRRGKEHQERIKHLADFIDDVRAEDRYNIPLDAMKYPPSSAGQVAHEAPTYYGLLAPQGVGVPHVLRQQAGQTGNRAWNVQKNPVCYIKREAFTFPSSSNKTTFILALGDFTFAARLAALTFGPLAARFSLKVSEPPPDGEPPPPPPPRYGWPSLEEPIGQDPNDLSEGTYKTALSTSARIFIETPIGLSHETAPSDGELELRVSGNLGTRVTDRLSWTVTRSALGRGMRYNGEIVPARHVGTPGFQMAIGTGAETEQEIIDRRTRWVPYGINPTGNRYNIRHQSYELNYTRPLPLMLRADLSINFDLTFSVDSDRKIATAGVTNVRTHLRHA